MEAAATLSLGDIHVVASKEVDWKKGIICQENKFPAKKFPLSKGTSVGISKVVQSGEVRSQWNDSSYKLCSSVVSCLKEKGSQDVYWHRQCYSDFTNKEHIQRLQNRASIANSDEAIPEPLTAALRRSSLDPVDWKKCVFCQTDLKKVALNCVQTMETSDKILKNAIFDKEMSCRLAGISDLIAEDCKYHLKCYTRFLRNTQKIPRDNQEKGKAEITCFEEVMSLLHQRLSEGHIYSIKAVWTYYSNRLEQKYQVQSGIYRSNRFKDRIQEFLGDTASFISPLNPSQPHLIVSSNLGEAALCSLLTEPNLSLQTEHGSCNDELYNDAIEDIDVEVELLSWLYRVAVKVHHDVKSAPTHDCIGNINQESAEEIVPESLFILISLLCTGCQREENKGDADLKARVLSICQDIVFLASRGRKLTPKHLGLGLTVHQATRSKELVQLLHGAGHSVSYETVLRMDNTIANDVLERYKENGNIFVPRNFADSTATYTRYAVDNIDINEETLSGMGTFHATQSAALRRKADGESTMDIQVSPQSARRLDLEVPSELHELSEISLENKKPEPVIEEPVEEGWYTPIQEKIDESYKKELAWILGRLAQQQPELQKLPGWSGFNQLLSNNDPEVTIVGPLPILNAPAHEFESLWTIILRCQVMTRLRSGKYTVVTMDEGLYNKAKMLQWAKMEELKSVVIVLGGFHTQMTFTKVIGKYLESSGISDIWAESEVFGETTAENILKGKLWNRVMRAHKLSYEALWRVLWPLLVLWAKDNGKDDKLVDLSMQLASKFDQSSEMDTAAYSNLIDEVGQVTDIVREFDATRQDDSTYCYWRQYMHLVCILLRFTRAIREGTWELYLSSFAEMLPWFAAFDHTNYTRWGVIFLTDMKLLPRTAPEVCQGFQSGDFVTKETKHAFNQIADDQALEHVNKSGKVAGGLVGITRTESARDRWCLTYNERAKLSEDTKAMFDVGAETKGASHKDLGKARMQRDEEHVLKLVSLFRRYDVFRETGNLVVVTTGDVASEEIKQDLLKAEEIGKTIVKEFVQARIIKKEIKFHDSLKQKKLKTFETLYSVPVSLDKSKTVAVKADRDLLRRVVVALESGRDVDVDTLLQKELSPVPLSIATLDGCLRHSSGKSDLGNILQQNVHQTQPPVSQYETCTIIDGMAAVQSLGNSPGSKTFGQWSDSFTAYVSSHFSDNCTRVDVVFDRYVQNSIKGGAREKRKDGKSKGIRRDVESREQRIANWDRFIVVEENKASLAHFLSTEMTQRYEAHPRRELVVSGGFNEILKVWSSNTSREDLQELSSDHEEADTRIVLHAKHAAAVGYKQLCRDTDVLVLLLAHREDLCEEIWMFSGTSRRKKYTPVHKIRLPEEKRKSLIPFHAITGCDTTSQFAGIGKQTAWKVFDSSPKLIEHLGEDCPPKAGVLADAEAFVCQLYNHGTDEVDIDKERAAAFRKVKKNLDTLPPTKDALHLHIRRANFQSMIWKKAKEPRPTLARPEENGWFLKEGVLKPQLTNQEEVSASCLQLAFCGCTREDSCVNRRCTCVRLSLGCSKGCKCGDACRNTRNNSVEADDV